MEMERTMQQMLQQLLANQVEMKAHQARMEAKIDAYRKADREALNEIGPGMDTRNKKMMAGLSWKDGGYRFQGKPRGNGIHNGTSGSP
jgi:hypothetical protein